MQQFDILGNVKVTAEVKTKIDDSPLVQKAPENMGLLNTNSNNLQQNIQDYTSEYLKNNNAILQEFGTVVSDAVRNLQLFNDKIRENINIPKISTGLDPNNGKTVFVPVNKFDNDDESNIINIIESPKNDNVIPNIVETPKENIADNKVIEKTIIQQIKEPQRSDFQKVQNEPIEKNNEQIIKIIESPKEESANKITPNIIEAPKNDITENNIIEKTVVQPISEPENKNFQQLENKSADNEEKIIRIVEAPKENDTKNITPNIIETPKTEIPENRTIEKTIIQQVTEPSKESLFTSNPVTPKTEEERIIKIDEAQKPETPEKNIIEKTIVQPENKAAEANVFNPVEPKEERIISIVEPSKNDIDSTPNIIELPRSEYSVKNIGPDNTIKEKTFIPSGENISAQNENINTQEKLQAWSEDLNTSSDSLKDNVEYMKQFGVLMPDMIKNFQAMNDIVNRTNQNLPAVGRIKTREDVKKQQLGAYTQQNILGMLNTGGNMIQSAAGGNIGGSVIQGVSGVASTASNLSKMANIEDMTGLAKGLMVGGGVLMAGAAVLKGGKALADAYKDAMPTIFSTGKAFGTTDDTKSMALYNTVNKNNEGTGLDLREFNSLVVDLRKQGVGDNLKNEYAQAAYTSGIAETTSKWAYAANADPSQFANFAGRMARYGKSQNVSEDFNYVMTAGLKANDDNYGKLSEFLSSVEKVMEDGIANGFSRSATEVADTLLMFSKMSGNNAFWQSEKGAKMLSQANSGLANATGLNKTSDIIAYSAISKAYSGVAIDEKTGKELIDEKTGKKISKEQAALGNDLYQDKGDYVNKMMLLEQGLNPQNFGSIMSSLIDVEGKENVTGQIERLREMFGLNYTGASRLLKLYQDNGGNVDESKIKNVMQAPENQNAETKWQKSVNQIAESIQKMGQSVFKVELGAMSGIASDVSKIANFLVKPEDNKPVVLSSNNVIAEQMEDEGIVNPEYYENKQKADEKLQELPSYKQKYAKSISSTIDPGAKGEGFLKVVDLAENLDLTQTGWDSPYVEKATYDDLGWLEKGFYNKSNIVGKSKILDEKGFKINKNFKNDTSVEDITADIFSHKLNYLLSKGKVSQDALMEGIANSTEYDKAITKAAKNGWIDNKEQINLANILQKIYDKLEEGIVEN